MVASATSFGHLSAPEGHIQDRSETIAPKPRELLRDHPDIARISETPRDVERFLRDTPISAFDGETGTLAAILPSDPHVFAFPDYGGPTGYVVTVGQPGFMTRFRLPASLDYRALHLEASFLGVDIIIETATGTTRTSLRELSQKIGFEQDENCLLAAFAALDGAIAPRVARPVRSAFGSATLGTVEPDFDRIWTAEPLVVPAFSDQALAVRLTDIEASDAERIERVVETFLDRAAENRAAASQPALDQALSFIQLVGRTDHVARRILAMGDSSCIWQFVKPMEIEIVRRDADGEPSFDVVLLCDCEWDEEHGLEFVYREGGTLAQVDEQGG